MGTRAEASLSPVERRVLDRLIRDLRDELRDDLRAVWLYGSRARGEPPRDEDSDVDVLVIVEQGSAAFRERVQRLVWDAATGERGEPFAFSVHVVDVEWVADRRDIEAFFIQEVDRDKVVLWGDGEVAVEGPRESRPGASSHAMRPRSEELLMLARDHLAAAQHARAGGHPLAAVPEAYFAMLDAARAALSEEDRHSRTHSGTWHLFREVFVDNGRFDPNLAEQAADAQKLREDAHYGGFREAVPPKLPSPEDAERVVAAAERFVEAVAAMYEPR